MTFTIYAFCVWLLATFYRAYLAGLLFGSDSASSRGALPNVFLKKLFFIKKNKGAGVAPPEEPSGGAVSNTPIVMNELVWQNHPRYSRSERSTPYP
jgi:hypothetical protein